MADEPELGTQGPAPELDDENAALVAELEAEQGGTPAVVKKPGAKPAPAKGKPAPEEAPDVEGDEDADEPAEVEGDAKPDDDAEDEDVEGDDDEDADGEDGEESEDDESDDELDEAAAKDPALKKRLDAARRTDERRRQRHEQERAGLERERTAWQAETKQVRTAIDRINALVARAKIDPAAVLEALGLTPDDMEYAGQQCYARGKSAAGKPEYKAAAERAARERELAEKATANATRIAELEAKLEAKEAAAAAERDLDAYFDKAFRKATDATPITARLIAKRPKAARAELAVTATRLVAKLGRMPKAAELLAAHEKREVRALKLRGIEPPKPGAGKPVAAAAAVKAGMPVVKSNASAKPVAVEPEVDDDVKIPSTADLVLAAAQRN